MLFKLIIIDRVEGCLTYTTVVVVVVITNNRSRNQAAGRRESTDTALPAARRDDVSSKCGDICADCLQQNKVERSIDWQRKKKPHIRGGHMTTQQHVSNFQVIYHLVGMMTSFKFNIFICRRCLLNKMSSIARHVQGHSLCVLK